MTPFRHGKKRPVSRLWACPHHCHPRHPGRFFAVPRMDGHDGRKGRGRGAEVAVDIAYAQELAMTRNVQYRVYVNAAPAPRPGTP